MKPSRIHRLLKLVTLLQTGRSYTSGDLTRELRIGRRTVFRDLAMLKLAGIPLLYDAAERSHRIEKSFFLPPVNLTLPEALTLMLLVQKSGVRSQLPDGEAASSALLKIESVLPIDIREHCGAAMAAIEVRSPPATELGNARTVFDRLWRAAREREKVAMSYDSYHERREIETVLHPYRLLFMTRGWYVIGYSTLHREVRTFKVERVLGAEATGERFPADHRFNLAEYFGNAWQMIRGDRRYGVRVRFSPKVAGNVEEVLWHPTQRTNYRDDGSLIFEAQVDGLDEIAWWVLGYGSEAVVESPRELRRIIVRHVRRLAERYGDEEAEPEQTASGRRLR